MRTTRGPSLVNIITKAVKSVDRAIIVTVVGLAMDTHIQVSTARDLLIPVEERKPVGALHECHLGLVVKRVAVETCVTVVREGVQRIAVVGIAVAAKWRMHVYRLVKENTFFLWDDLPDNTFFGCYLTAPFPAVHYISLCVGKRMGILCVLILIPVVFDRTVVKVTASAYVHKPLNAISSERFYVSWYGVL